MVNVVGVWLTARRTLWCWSVGVLAVLLYVWIVYDVKLYPDMLLQVVFAVMQGYGGWRWRTGRMDHGKVLIEPLSGQLPIVHTISGLQLHPHLNAWQGLPRS